MAGRPTRAQELGITQEIVEEDDGSYSFTLREQSGVLLYAKEGYTAHKHAQDAASRWLRDNYRPAPKPAPSSAGTGRILGMLRSQAMDNETQAQRLRQQADLLEAEAKKLHAAANALEDPEG
jgi:uncharacterized protein YegP (UPF0339 family)